jgi:hypothetical protein
MASSEDDVVEVARARGDVLPRREAQGWLIVDFG